MKTVQQHLERVPIDSIQPHPRNPRKGDQAAIRQSIERNGFYGAVIVQASTRFILAGSHRWRELQAAGAVDIPALLVDVDDVTARRILLADNRTNDLASYHDEILLLVLESLQTKAGTLSGSGFDEKAYENLLKKREIDVRADKQSEGRVTVVVGGYKQTFSAERFEAWQRALHEKVGTGKADIERELRSRLGIA